MKLLGATVLLVVLLQAVQPAEILSRQIRAAKKGGCKYKKAPWGECDKDTNQQTRTRTLKKGDPDKCDAQLVETRDCKKAKKSNGCKYSRGQWSACDATTNKKSMTLTLKQGKVPAGPTCPQTKDIQKTCGGGKKKGKKNKNGRKKGCKYMKGKWSLCDSTANTRTRTLTLKKGDATKCQATQVQTKKCKKACRYQKGDWTQCDTTTNMKERIDRLRPGSETSCDATRKVTRQCKVNRAKCSYNFGTWTECINGYRTRTKILMPGQTATCDKSVVVRKPCTFKNGKERCFFGPWGEFGACQNGVQRKTRPVIKGGDNCQTRAVKVKQCKK